MSEFPKLHEQALAMSAGERCKLAQALIESLPASARAPFDEIDAAWREEVHRRLGLMDKGEIQWLDGSQADAEIEAAIKNAG